MKKCKILILFFALCPLFAMAQLNTDRVMSMGKSALYFEDYVLSIQYFNQVIKVKSYLSEPYFYRAIAKIELEDYNGAEQDLNEVIKRNSFMAHAYYARGYARMHLEKYADAAIDFAKAVEFKPDNKTYTLLCIEANLQLENYDVALTDIDNLLKRGRTTDLLYERGRVLFASGDTLAALANYNEMVEKDVKNSDAWAARAVLKIQMDNDSGALADYNEAIRLGSHQVSCYINRGLLNYESKNYRGALADYDKAVELAPDDEVALFNRSLLRAEVGDLNRAIEDLTAVLKLRPDYEKAIYQRAIVYADLHEWQLAIDDYSNIIKRFPTFAPAYYGRAQAYEKLGKKRAAFDDYDKARRLREEAKNKKDKTEEIDTKPELAQSTDDNSARTRLFDSNVGATTNDNIRGSIQNHQIDVSSEKNFVLSYYQKEDLVRKGERYSRLVSDQNAKRVLLANLKIVNREMPLTQSLINNHFRSIDEYSRRIEVYSTNAELYFARGIDYALVQDFASAINDFSHAIFYDSNLALAYFCRANIRFKELEFSVNNGNDDASTEEKTYAYDFEMIMRDYDKVLELAPDFAFAWFNRANVLCVQKDFQMAIRNYTNAIDIDSEFAEAYFNRGLTYIYIGETAKGIDDLSKAGELGIYQAYSYLKRIRN